MNAIDLPALRGLLINTETEIAELKAMLGRTWTRPMAAEQRTLLALKLRATNLYIVRALMRGRYHLSRPPRRCAGDWNQHTFHQTVAAETADRYTLHREIPCQPNQAT